MGDLPFIDTNIFLRFLVKDPVNPHLNIQAKEIWQQIEKDKLKVQTHVLVIAEVVYVLESYYQKSKTEVRSLVEPMLALTSMTLPEKEELVSALQLSEDKNVDFTDAYTYVLMIEAGQKAIYTFDKQHFKRLGNVEVRP